jgi:hypothetical protein
MKRNSALALVLIILSLTGCAPRNDDQAQAACEAEAYSTWERSDQTCNFNTQQAVADYIRAQQAAPATMADYLAKIYGLDGVGKVTADPREVACIGARGEWQLSQQVCKFK